MIKRRYLLRFRRHLFHWVRLWIIFPILLTFLPTALVIMVIFRCIAPKTYRRVTGPWISHEPEGYEFGDWIRQEIR